MSYDSSRYAPVFFDGKPERVLIYVVNLEPPGIPLELAKDLAMQEFPADARIDWYREYPTCARMSVVSPTIAEALSDYNFVAPDGRAGVTFYLSSLEWDPNGIDSISVVARDDEAPPDDGNC